MSAILPIDNIETKHSLHRGEYCMKKIYSSLRQHTTNVINFEKKKMLLLTKKKLNVKIVIVFLNVKASRIT